MKEANFVTATEVNQFSEDMNELLVDPDANAIQSLCSIWENNTHETAEARLQIFYNIGTGYSAIARHKEAEFDEKSTGLATLNYRKALAEAYHIEKNGVFFNTEELRQNYIDQKASLETNLAYELMNQGRSLEAIPLFNSAISVGNIHSVFGKAQCLFSLGSKNIDSYKQFYLLQESANLFEESVSRVNEFYDYQQNSVTNHEWSSFVKEFRSEEKKLKSTNNAHKEILPINSPKKEDTKYFQWCAKHILFINELNSIRNTPLVHNDNMHLPNFRGTLNDLLEFSEELSFHGHYDEMKSDFCYARYITYLGFSQENYNPHFFNSTFDHIDTLDYQINDLKANHLKSGFKISYSIFDKIAFFLHRFFKILDTSKDNQIDFKKVWFSNKTKPRDQFESSSNPHFRALFFLSKDIRQGNNCPNPSDHSFWFDPDTNRLFDIRNAIEHRSFKLVDGDLYRISRKHSYAAIEIEKNREEFDQISQQLEDLYNLKPLNPEQKNSIKILKVRLAKVEEDFKEQQSLSSYSLTIGIEEFERLTLKLLSLAKDALIYLSLSIEHEEQKREPFDGVLVEREVPMR